jgi:hypothetical protein
MSQGFLAAEPITGSRAFGSLYLTLRTNFQALQSAHSGTSWPASPVGGQLCWRTDYSPRRLYIYNDLGSTWDEVALATAGLGLELIAARGAHASLDARLDAQINEDGTFKASTASGINPSQWYDLTKASGWVSTTSFKAMGADYTPTYKPTRRLKINRDSGSYYTEVVSSSYGAPDTTIVTRDAVCGASQAAFRNVSHSIIAPRKDSGGDGAVSFEMVANMGMTSGGGNLNIGDSVIFANGTGTTTLQTVGNYGSGRPIFLVNIHATQSHTFAAYSGQTINGASSVTVGPGQSVIIFNNGSTWYRFDMPNISSYVDWSASASPAGFSSVGVCTVKYLKVGKLVFVYFYINGTSNGATCGFTLPTGTETPGINWTSGSIRATDNGTELTTPAMAMVLNNYGSPNYVYFYKDFHGAGWTPSGNKIVSGSFTYIADI